MDAFSGYNQIKMEEEDQEKTSFVTSQGLFCYKVMPFGLKNAGATYQRLMNKMFAHQLGRNVQHEAEPEQVRVRGYGRTILGIHGVSKGYRSQPRESASHNGVRAPEDSEGSSELERKSCGPEQIRLQSDR